MLKNNTASPQYEIEMISLEQLVPKDHLVRKVAKAIDFDFIRDEVAHLYCHDNGRPAVDPVRLFKIMLLGYLFGIKSERQLVKEIEVNVAYRWFLGMSLTEKVIDASTLSQTVCAVLMVRMYLSVFLPTSFGKRWKKAWWG